MANKITRSVVDLNNISINEIYISPSGVGSGKSVTDPTNINKIGSKLVSFAKNIIWVLPGEHVLNPDINPDMRTNIELNLGQVMEIRNIESIEILAYNPGTTLPRITTTHTSISYISESTVGSPQPSQTCPAHTYSETLFLFESCGNVRLQNLVLHGTVGCVKLFQVGSSYIEDCIFKTWVTNTNPADNDVLEVPFGLNVAFSSCVIRSNYYPINGYTKPVNNDGPRSSSTYGADFYGFIPDLANAGVTSTGYIPIRSLARASVSNLQIYDDGIIRVFVNKQWDRTTNPGDWGSQFNAGGNGGTLRLSRIIQKNMSAIITIANLSEGIIFVEGSYPESAPLNYICNVSSGGTLKLTLKDIYSATQFEDYSFKVAGKTASGQTWVCFNCTNGADLLIDYASFKVVHNALRVFNVEGGSLLTGLSITSRRQSDYIGPTVGYHSQSSNIALVNTIMECATSGVVSYGLASVGGGSVNLSSSTTTATNLVAIYDSSTASINGIGY